MDYKVYLERKIVTEVIREIHRTGNRLSDSAQSQLHQEIRERIVVMVSGEPEDVEVILATVRADAWLSPAPSAPLILRPNRFRAFLDALPTFWPFTE